MKNHRTALKNICIRITKGTTPTTMGRPFVGEGINFVKAEALNGDTSLERSGFAFIDDDTHRILQRSILEKNDVLVTIAGANTGRCGFVREIDIPANTNQAVGIIRVDKEKAEPRFIYYFFKQKNTFRYIQTLSAQAAQPNLNLTNLGNIEVKLPPKGEQRRFAAILSAYDDLIENNRRRIQLLEQAARLLYKEWFVHLRFPGHEHVTITDGLPEGWEMKQVKDVLGKVKRPRKIKKSEFLDEGPIPCVDQSRDFIGGYTNDEEAIVDIGQPVIVFGDHTRILKFVDFPFACGADGTQLIVSNDEVMSQEFMYFALDAIDLSNYFYARHFKFLKDQYIPRPPNMLLSQFTNNARPILKQIKSLRDHSHYLAQARDLLLPRLMNGEVAV